MRLEKMFREHRNVRAPFAERRDPQVDATQTVIEIGPTEEPAGFVMKRDLALWSRQAREDEQQAQAGLHRRFGSRVGQPKDAPQLGDPLRPTVGPLVGAELVEGDAPSLQRHVDCHHRFHQTQAAPEIYGRPQ